MTNAELKTKLQQAYGILYMEGMAEDTTRGHMTVKADDGALYVKPWGMGFEEVKAESLLKIDMEGNVLEGAGRPHSEILIHLAIYRRRPDVAAVVHVHPPHAVLLSAVYRGSLIRVGQHSLHFGRHVPYYDIAELIHSPAQAEKLAELLGDGPAVLMRNHGLVIAGRCVAEATVMAIDFEKAVREHLEIAALGEYVEMDDAMAERMAATMCRPQQYQMLWDYYCRKLERRTI